MKQTSPVVRAGRAATSHDPSSAPSRMSDITRSLSGLAPVLRTGGVIVLCGAALLRALSANILQASFDLDPLLAGAPQPGIVPASGLAIDAVMLVAASAILLGEVLAARRVPGSLSEPRLASSGSGGGSLRRCFLAVSLRIQQRRISLRAAVLARSRADGGVLRQNLVWPFLLALLPLPVLFWHGMERGEHAWRGSTWFAAVFGAVALAHAARDPGLRRLAVAMLLAGLAPLVLRGASQVLIEHPAAVRQYVAIRDAFLADRGWAPDSAAARIYEERLRQPEASGWFGFANVASSFFAAGTIALSGVLLELWCVWRQRSTSMGAPDHDRPLPSTGAVGLMVLLAAGTATLLVVNGSKGALAAAAVGVVVMAMRPRLFARAGAVSSPLPVGEGASRSEAGEGSGASRVSGPPSSGLRPPFGGARGMPSPPSTRLRADEGSSGVTRLAPFLAPLLILAALTAVIARGVLLPESFAGERSVLFRWHYMSDAARVVAAHPLLGVGPDGFQEAMIAVRPVRHPEEVSSAHSVLVDWVVALGPLGFSWVIVLLALLMHGGAAAARCADASTSAPRAFDRRRTLLAGAGMTALLLSCVVIEASILDPTTLVFRLVGVALGVGVFLALRSALAAAEARWMLFAAACVIAVHAQIEMSFFLQGSVAWALLLVAAACPLPQRAPRLEDRFTARPSGPLIAIVPAAIALVIAALLVTQAIPLWRQERLMADAASPLERLVPVRAARAELAAARDPAAWRNAGERVQFNLAVIGIDEESAASMATLLAEPDPARREVAIRTLDELLRREEGRARQRAIEGLNLAWSIDERNIRPLLAAIDQALRAAAVTTPDERELLLFRTLATLNYVIAEREDTLRVRRRHAELLEVAARAVAERGGDPQRSWRRAMEAWEEVVKRDPASSPALLRLADCAEAGARPQRAITALEQALAVDDQLHLDPRKQLGEMRRRAILARLERLRNELHDAARSAAAAAAAAAAASRPSSDGTAFQAGPAS